MCSVLADRTQVWCTHSLNRLYSIYSTYDVGDLFCVAYSASLKTVYLGAQNTSIQVGLLSRVRLERSLLTTTVVQPGRQG